MQPNYNNGGNWGQPQYDQWGQPVQDQWGQPQQGQWGQPQQGQYQGDPSQGEENMVQGGYKFTQTSYGYSTYSGGMGPTTYGGYGYPSYPQGGYGGYSQGGYGGYSQGGYGGYGQGGFGGGSSFGGPPAFIPGSRKDNIGGNTQWNDADGDGIDDSLGLFQKVINYKHQEDMDALNNLSQFAAKTTLDQNKGPTIISNLYDFNIKPDKAENAKDNVDDNGDDDLEGDDREWQNWNVDSFVPKATTQGKDTVIFDDADFAKFEKLNAELKQWGQKYIDKDFPAEAKSIVGFGEGGIQWGDAGKLDWQRPEVLFKDQNYKLYEWISLHDIQQGGLGDCYFLGAIAAVAEHPNRLKRLFMDKYVNQYNRMENGAYCVGLCINGMWEDIIIDDRFVCQPISKKPYFVYSDSKEIWVMLLEKAWAKVHGGFNNIDGGLTREALRDLTGASAITFFNQQSTPDEHWRIIKDGELNNYIMTAGTKDIANTGNDSQDQTTGLAGNHAYWLLSAYEIITLPGGERRVAKQSEWSPANERIVKLRNPWGKGEWNGDWSDSWHKWTPQLRHELGMEKKDDGVFFMPFNIFQKYYSDYQVCYYKDDYKYSAERYTSLPSEPTVIKFNVTVPGEFYLTVNQTNRRFFKESDNYTYTPVTMMVAKIEGEEVKYIGSVQKADKENWFKAHYPAGQYVAYILTPWRRKVNQFALWAYGPEIISFWKQDKGQYKEELITKLLLQKAISDPSNFNAYAEQGQPDIKYKYENSNDGFGYWVFVNNAKDDTVLTATIELVKFENAELLAPFQGNMKPIVTVPPGSSKIIAYIVNQKKTWSQDSVVSFRMMASFKQGTSNIFDKVKSKGTKVKKLEEGCEVGIDCYVLFHREGVVYLYENHSKDYQLTEYISFNLVNCKIEGFKGKALEVSCVPEEQVMLNIVITDKTRPFSANVIECSYEIDPFPY